MISDPVFGGLAISLIFGAFASTTLTLFVIPLTYYLAQDWSRRRHARRHAGASAAARTRR